MKKQFPHRFKYTAENVELDDVVDSLQAQKALLLKAVSILEILDENFITENTRISVLKLENGSLLAELLIEFYATYQNELEDKVIGAVEALTGADVPENLEPLVTLLTLASVYWVSRFIYDSVNKKNNSSPGVQSHIEGEQNTVINIIVEKLNITPEEFSKAMDKGFPDSEKRRLINPVRKFFKVAKTNVGSTIEYPDIEEGYAVSKEAISEFPSDAQIESIVDIEMRDIPNAIIELRATDRDKVETGWGAKILDNKKYKKRLPMSVYPTIDVDALAKETTIKGDVCVEVKVSDNGKEKARRIHLLTYKPFKKS